ncbi:hypothetical protein BJV82DRAFT_614178 [Fennellomyces sp. T-0311]|nr:hypothetical protein BJV82DRAFT_614178 [Fennellomyces sp. T-0311]
MLRLLYKSPLHPVPSAAERTMKDSDIQTTNPITSGMDDEEFQQAIEEAVEEIEECANKIGDLGNSYIAKMNNTFVLLTILGFVPAAMALIDYLEEPYYVFVLCITLVAASTFYGLYYIIQYWAVPELLRFLLKRLVRSKDELFSSFDEETTEKYKIQVIDETRKTAREARLTFESLARRRGMVDGACQIIMGVLSFVVVILLLVGEKDEEEWSIQGVAELTFAVWMFFANGILAIVYAIISTRKMKKKWGQTKAVARAIARKEADAHLMV